MRKARILNILLVGFLILATVSLFIIIFHVFIIRDGYNTVPPSIGFTFFFVFCFLYILSKLGLHRLVSFLFISAMYIAATYTAVTWGGDIPMSLLLFSLIIVMSGILIGTRFALIMLVVTLGTLIFVGYSQIYEIITPKVNWRSEPVSSTDFFNYAATLGVIGLVSWLFNREMEAALRRVRRSEQELIQEKEHLEIRVKERTKQLQTSQLERLQEVNRFASFGRLSSGLIHDLINPLTAVSLRLQNLESDSDNEPLKKTIVPIIHDVISDTRVMEELIVAARKQYQSQKMLTEFFPSEEIEQIVRMLQYRAKKHTVRLLVHTDSTIRLVGDPIKFHQVVTNIVSNAIDSLRDISIKNKRLVTIGLHTYAKHVVLTITDTGTGIIKENAQHIFEPLFTTKPADQGSGIGLYLCKEIVEKDFGGKIVLKKTGPKGSTFVVLFPVEKKRGK